MWDKNQLWQNVLGEIEVGVSAGTFSMWIRPCFIDSLMEIDGQRLLIELACPTLFARSTIDERYYAQIKRVLESQTGRQCELALVVKQRPVEPVKVVEDNLFEQKVVEEIDERDLLLENGLNPKFSFSNFVVGSSNDLAYAAAKGIVDMPGARHNPLFIFGGVGVGKTHLMHAVGRALAEQGLKNVRALTIEHFTNEFVATLKTKTIDNFKKRYRNVDALLIDDIQFIAGKEQTQEEFFHTFNDLHQKGRQIIITSDKKPQELEGIEQRLVSRFSGGLTVDIGLPTYEMRLAILKQKATEMGVEVEDDALDLIASSVKMNSRELGGLFMQIVNTARNRPGGLSKQLVAAELGVSIEKKEKRLRPQEVISLIAKEFDLKNKEIVGSSRKAELVRARHLAMYILRKEMGLTLHQVAELMGRSDHTTVLHAVEKMTHQFMADQIVRGQIMKVKQAIYH